VAFCCATAGGGSSGQAIAPREKGPERRRAAGAGSASACCPRHADRSLRLGEPRSPGCPGRPSWPPRASFPRETGARNRKEKRVVRSESEAQRGRRYHVRQVKVVLLMLFITGLAHPFSLPTCLFLASVSRLSPSYASPTCVRRRRIASLHWYKHALALKATHGEVPGEPSCIVTYPRLHPQARLHSKKTVTPVCPRQHMKAFAVPPQQAPSRPLRIGSARTCSIKYFTPIPLP